MAYQFTNQSTGQAKATDTENVEFTVKGINTSGNNADEFRAGLVLLLDIVGWTLADAKRIVTQDVEEVT